MNHLSLITKREYLNKVKNKSFIIMTFLSPLIFVAIFALIGFLTQLNNDGVKTISVLDESNLFASKFKNTENTKYDILTGLNLDDAKKLVREAENYGLLYIPPADNVDAIADKIKFYSEESPSVGVMNSIEDKIEEEARAIKLKESGLDPIIVNKLKIKVRANLETFDGQKTSKAGNYMKLIFGGAAGYLLFMFIIIYGNMIMRSVIEEKTSRIIEIIISSVKPIKLLLGKIFGTSLAGLTQFAVWIIIGTVLMLGVSAFFGVQMSQSPMAEQQQEMMKQVAENDEAQQMATTIFQEINNLPLANLIIMFILFFIGGYLLYASLYAAIGAAVDNETDTQQFMMPIIMPLMLAIYVGFFTVIENPHGMVSQVFSYIPFTSPVVMLMRIPFGVPIWQQLLSVLILFVTFYITVMFAAKIYRVGILMYGKKPTYKELYKWLKY
ncbi:ABC transporter permease [Aureibaculum sp. 2210JD6-5]|uniref:ABC transporter permease n=1 Tax=Aureibaculum sp. 2210JD6-5 TaxID=3103957 RepID=UPI002AAE75ED|nr:ABC transporter permease [Aureibaculum sp. 2210JD6-5]MDY7395257.1 ABC transporter permease [Aureibaculum sp. 2210JD6-5]